MSLPRSILRQARSISSHLKDPLGTPDDTVTDPRKLLNHASLRALVVEIGRIIEANFPGHPFMIMPEERQGVVSILHAELSGSKNWGTRMHIPNVQDDFGKALRDKTVRLVGEFLERFGQPRGRYRRDLIAAVPRDALGDPIPDDLDVKKTLSQTMRDKALRGELDHFIRTDKGLLVGRN